MHPQLPSVSAARVEWELLPSLMNRLVGRRSRAQPAWRETLPSELDFLEPSDPFEEVLPGLEMREVREPIATIVSADLPLLRAEDVLALIDATPGRGIAIARATDGGTNAVSMRPSGAMRTCFGEPQSARLHAALADEAGLQHAIVRCTHVYGPGSEWLAQTWKLARGWPATVLGPDRAAITIRTRPRPRSGRLTAQPLNMSPSIGIDADTTIPWL